jgi:hypothetical protein
MGIDTPHLHCLFCRMAIGCLIVCFVVSLLECLAAAAETLIWLLTEKGENRHAN